MVGFIPFVLYCFCCLLLKHHDMRHQHCSSLDVSLYQIWRSNSLIMYIVVICCCSVMQKSPALSYLSIISYLCYRYWQLGLLETHNADIHTSRQAQSRRATWKHRALSIGPVTFLSNQILKTLSLLLLSKSSF